MIFTNAYASRLIIHHHHHHHTGSTVHRRSSNRGCAGGGAGRSPPFTIRCCNNSDSNSGRGFGPQKSEDPVLSPTKPSKGSAARDGKDKAKSAASRQRKLAFQQTGSIPSQAPGTNSRTDGTSKSFASNLQFEERLQAVKRSALDQKKAEVKNTYGAIDYDAPITSEPSKIGLGTKIGVGVAVVVFGLVFAFGDFLPSGSVNPDKAALVAKNTLSPEEKEKLQTRLQEYEAALKISPDDRVALEGEAVTLTELGEYTRAASMLEDLTKMKPSDPEAFRLLGEVKLELKDYEGSAAAYRSSAMVSGKMDFEVLRGLTNALLAAKKPDEAVQILLATRDSLAREKENQANTGADGSLIDTQSQIDPIQVGLLLGKAYSDWGHVSDAVSVYDQLISSHPDDFRGYLAKGIILKANGKSGDAERMFIQRKSSLCTMSDVYGLHKNLDLVFLGHHHTKDDFHFQLPDIRRPITEFIKTREAGEFLSGALAGAMTKAVLAPLETIRTRMVVGVGSRKISGSFLEVIEKQGWQGLWAGNAINMIRIVPTQAIELGTFECVKRVMTSAKEKWIGEDCPSVQIGGVKLSFSLSWLSPVAVGGAAAGFVSTLVCHPLEVLKDRLTISPDTYPNLGVAVQKIYRNGGVGSFYAGLSPTLIGMLPYSTCYYFMYDTIKKSYCTAQKKKSLSRPEMLLIGALSGLTASTISFPLEVARKRLMVGALQGKCPPHMAAALSEVVREEGVMGLYRGWGASCLKVMPEMFYEAWKDILLGDKHRQ